VLPLGIAMGLAVPLVLWIDSGMLAVPLLLAVGALGGAMVVPLNALLQHRGHVLLTAGRSIAIQNFNENLSMLVMLAAFAALVALEIDVAHVMAALGLIVAAVVAVLWRNDRRRRRVLRARAVIPPSRTEPAPAWRTPR
jgi:MFS transporter, LPLT family, lysophospholipid transporter